MSTTADRLRSLKTFEDLTGYLEDELGWELQGYDFDQLTFEYQPSELGLKDEDAAKVRRIHQLRPLEPGQPWGIFFVEFEKKKLPIVVLRRILSHLVIKKRADANRAKAAAWDASDLLFISAFGDETAAEREIAFAHFHQEAGDLPTLRVLGWDGGDTPLKLDHVAATLKSKLHWPDDPLDHAAWREQWSRAFKHRIGHVIRTADALAEVLATLARGIRDAAQTMIQHETDRGQLRRLHRAFQTALIHDLTEEDFADTYAQTITYGLLTAAISRTDMSENRLGTALLADNLADIVPVTNPFLKEMLQTFLRIGGRKGGIDFDELGIQEVVELLRDGNKTDLQAVLRDFGNKTRGEDPVIHFYEHFLSAYNKKLKVQRGVFYTPQPVVSYIVRSVHELLQTEFGLEDGLADITTWEEFVTREQSRDSQSPLRIPEGVALDSPFVQILDPATGTATFLVEVIDVIHRTLTDKWKHQGLNEAARRAAWNEYVPQHLLPRLHGYELMMAPYAIAHMKLPLKLTETGFTAWHKLSENDRVRIYLTNAMEAPTQDKKQMQLGEWFPALAHEAHSVNTIKVQQRFTVVIGNPPYSGHSANTSKDERGNPTFIGGLLRDYFEVNGQPLGERNPKWLQDDYVKFIRLAQWNISRTGVGIVGFITNHGYLDNTTFRGMRQNLLKTFTTLYVLDLHGNIMRREIGTSGEKDENVFDIQQGVSILLAFRSLSNTHDAHKCSVHNLDAFGLREYKYNFLRQHNVGTSLWTHIQPSTDLYMFVPQNRKLAAEFEIGWPIQKVFPVNNVGLVTGQDDETIAFSEKDALQLALKHRLRPETVKPILYRPFDRRFIVYDKSVVTRPRLEIMPHLFAGKNLGLIFMRQVALQDAYTHFGVSNASVDNRAFYSNKGIMSMAPLYLYNTHSLLIGNSPFREPNLASGFLDTVAAKLRLSFVQEGKGNLKQTFGPEAIFHFAYAVFHSPEYRSRYAEFLKIDFPRLPLTSSLELFRALDKLGGELVALHLVEFALEDETSAPTELPRYPRLARFDGTDRSIEKFPAADKAWKDGRVSINASSSFEGVPEAVWKFHIGGYQVCHKWLKDRKGRSLSDEDILHYCKIVTALNETIRLMRQIDEVINEHGGWPGAFATAEPPQQEGKLPFA